MNVARLNFSHGDHASHARMLDMLRQANAARPSHHVAVMLDTKGPEIRTGLLRDKTAELVEGQDLEITSDYTFVGDSHKIAMNYDGLKNLRVGQIIKMSDDTIRLEVKSATADGVIVRVLNAAKLGEKKNVNVPGAHLDVPTILEKDKVDLVEFGVRYNVDMIALSFCRFARDVIECREVMGEAGRHIKVIAKIEDWIGLENVPEILRVTDGVMVARGDLGMELETEKIFLAQKWIIRQANIVGIPVITATQMMESIIEKPRPTRAECTDVANAVLDGSDAVMLSGETAQGKTPVAAVKIMASIAVEAARSINYPELNSATRNSVMAEFGHLSPVESVAHSAAKTALDVDAKLMVVLSETAQIATLVCKFRPGIPILVATTDPATARWVDGLLCSAKAILFEAPKGEHVAVETLLAAGEAAAVMQATAWGWLKARDRVVVVVGEERGVWAHCLNSFKVIEVAAE